jgi:hypothetical protein
MTSMYIIGLPDKTGGRRRDEIPDSCSFGGRFIYSRFAGAKE